MKSRTNLKKKNEEKFLKKRENRGIKKALKKKKIIERVKNKKENHLKNRMIRHV